MVLEIIAKCDVICCMESNQVGAVLYCTLLRKTIRSRKSGKSRLCLKIPISDQLSTNSLVVSFPFTNRTEPK